MEGQGVYKQHVRVEFCQAWLGCREKRGNMRGLWRGLREGDESPVRAAGIKGYI